MGKSTVSAELAARGFPVVDTDDLARELTGPEGAALPAIERTFGAEVFVAPGRLDRGKLADLVFADEARQRELERILHPSIRRRWQERKVELAARGRTPAFVAVPLLYEIGAEAEFDGVVCVACREEDQLERLKARGWSELQSRNRIGAQWDIARKTALADRVIWTSCSRAAVERQVEAVALWTAGVPEQESPAADRRTEA